MKNTRFAVAAISLLLLNPVQAETPPPDELERSVALMAKVGACWSPSFSPDGTRIAFVSNMSGVPQIYIMPASGGFPEQVTALDDAVDEVDWSPTGEFLAFAVAPGGGLNTQLYIMKPDGSGMRRLTDGGKENNFMDRWSADGKILAISSNRRDPATTDSYFIDLASGKLQMVAENKGIGGVQDISRDNRFAIINRLQNRGDNNLYLVEVATGKEALLTPHEGPGSFGSAWFTPDGQTIYFISNKDRDLTAFARVRLGKEGRPGDVEVIAARDDAEAAGSSMNDEGTNLALLWNVAGKNELAFFDIKAGKASPGPAPSRGRSWGKEAFPRMARGWRSSPRALPRRETFMSWI